MATEHEAHLSLIEVLTRYPQHARGLLRKVEAGEIDGAYPGGTETHPCGCVIGSLAGLLGRDRRWIFLDEVRRACQAEYTPTLPIEDFVYSIRPGHTPANNPTSALLAEWIAEFIANPEAVRR